LSIPQCPFVTSLRQAALSLEKHHPPELSGIAQGTHSKQVKHNYLTTCHPFYLKDPKFGAMINVAI
jgi:hypothetical protein